MVLRFHFGFGMVFPSGIIDQIFWGVLLDTVKIIPCFFENVN